MQIVCAWKFLWTEKDKFNLSYQLERNNNEK